MAKKLLGSLVCGVVVGACVYYAALSSPRAFVAGTYVKIEEGDTLQDIAERLRDANVVRVPVVFEALVRLFAGDKHIQAGEYYFGKRQNVVGIATRISDGIFGLEAVKVLIPEGTNNAQMARIFADRLPLFDSASFLKEAKSYEGYLFPDTYFVYPGTDNAKLILLLKDTFNARIAKPDVQKAITSFGKPLSQVISMASLVEKEAPDTVNRKIIAGILWKRLSLGMPLQVDAVFPYITGKPGEDIQQTDYAIDSPYNTYLYKGLPPGPITNPGLDAILAAVAPTPSKYLYYLSDPQGNFHYSRTFDEHLANQRKYLR